jgi:hypothetical protein
MKEIQVDLIGTEPLILHNCARLLNPFDPTNREKKALTDKRTKQSDEDRLQVAKLEWTMGWYLGEDGDIVMPTQNIWSSFLAAAKKTREGTQFKDAVTMTSLSVPLIYEGPRDLEQLWGKGLEGSPFVDYRPVGQQAVKIMRCRPVVRDWAVSTTWMVDETILNPEAFSSFANKAGEYVGIGDFRMRYGRFDAKVS